MLIGSDNLIEIRGNGDLIVPEIVNPRSSVDQRIAQCLEYLREGHVDLVR